MSLKIRDQKRGGYIKMSCSFREEHWAVVPGTRWPIAASWLAQYPGGAGSTWRTRSKCPRHDKRDNDGAGIRAGCGGRRRPAKTRPAEAEGEGQPRLDRWLKSSGSRGGSMRMAVLQGFRSPQMSTSVLLWSAPVGAGWPSLRSRSADSVLSYDRPRCNEVLARMAAISCPGLEQASVKVVTRCISSVTRRRLNPGSEARVESKSNSRS